VGSQNLAYDDIDQLLPILAGRQPRRLHASLQPRIASEPRNKRSRREIVCVNFALTIGGEMCLAPLGVKDQKSLTAAPHQKSDDQRHGGAYHGEFDDRRRRAAAYVE
jgi:hypothetical protein